MRRILLSVSILGIAALVAAGWMRGAGQTRSEDPFADVAKVSILLLGTFHFKDAGLDSYQPKHDIDILSPERQKEVEFVIERLAAFKPSKIALEWKAARQTELDSRFEAYLSGDYQLSSSELDQLGLRLARQLDHKRVYAVDAERRFYEPWVDPDQFAVRNGQQHLLAPGLWQRFERHWANDDHRKTQHTLAETLLHINSEKQILRSHGAYVIGNLAVGTPEEYPGVDSKIAWYNRNLRIFANLMRLKEDPQERILLIIGSGHLPIIRHSIQASPEYELVEVASVLR